MSVTERCASEIEANADGSQMSKSVSKVTRAGWALLKIRNRPEANEQ